MELDRKRPAHSQIDEFDPVRTNIGHRGRQVSVCKFETAMNSFATLTDKVWKDEKREACTRARGRLWDHYQFGIG
jgi:hypothetical protein